jgi:hypothetical protein
MTRKRERSRAVAVFLKAEPIIDKKAKAAMQE